MQPIRLQQINDQLRPQVGEKAYWLGQLHGAQTFTVPDGYVLPLDFLLRAIDAQGVMPEFQRLTQAPQVINRFVQLQRLIQNLAFDADAASTLTRLFEELGGVVAVRSSSAFEDRDTHGSAGLYTSVTGVDSVEGLERAIRACFLSNYSEAVRNLNPAAYGGPFGVIVQRYVSFDRGGVAFSCHPLTLDPEVVTVDLGQSPEHAVSGEGDVEQIEVSRAALRAGTVAPMLQQLGQALFEVEARFEKAVDVEWGTAGDELFLVQARPVTALKPQPQTVQLIDVDDQAACLTAPLGNQQNAHLRWLNKKQVLRQACRELRIDVPTFKYLLLPEGWSVAEVEPLRVADHFRTEDLQIFDGQSYKNVKRDALDTYLQALPRQAHQLRVQEFVPTTAAGYAAQTSEGDIFIEAIPGLLFGFWQGGMEPSTYKVMRDGSVQVLRESTLREYYNFVGTDEMPSRIPLDVPVTHRVAPALLHQVADMCRNLTARFGEIRMEWLQSGENIHFFDLSMESKTLRETSYDGRVLSLGAGEGVCRHLADVDVLDVLFDDALVDIDVVPKQKFLDILQSDACRTLVDSICGHDGKPIIVAEYPKRTLAVLCGHVAGFIFERGSLLCHMAIIAREHGIPALVVPEARQQFAPGVQLRVTANTVQADLAATPPA